MSITRNILFLIMFSFGGNVYAQADSACCTVIDMIKDSGTVIIRDNQQGWIKLFKPDALEFAGIRIGDTIHASALLNQVNKINGIARRYPLKQPFYQLACCEIVSIFKEEPEYTITARKVSGDSLQFKVPDSIAASLAVGSRIYTSPTHGYAMVLAPTAQKDSIFYGFPYLQR